MQSYSLREELLRLAEKALAAQPQISTLGELIRHIAVLHDAEVLADKKSAEAEVKAERRRSLQEAHEARKGAAEDKLSREQAAKEAAREAKEAEAALERAKIKAEAKQKAEEKALKEAEQAALAAAEARTRAEELAQAAKAAVDVADIEANQPQSEEQSRISAAAQSWASKAQKEADRAEEKRRKAEEKALRAAERHAERAREKAGAALDVALAAAARLKDMGGELPAEGGSGGHSPGGASSIASHRLRRASSRLRRLSGGMGDEDGDSEAEDEAVADRDRVYYGDGSQLGMSAAEALEVEQAVEAEKRQQAAERARVREEEEARMLREQSGIGTGGIDAWRGGGLRGAAMPAHVAVQSDCVAVDAVERRICCVGGDGTDDALTVSLYSAIVGEPTRHLRGHTDKVVSVAVDGDRVASGSRDRSIRLWSIALGQCIQTLAGCAGPVYGLALRDTTMLSGEGGTDRGSAAAKLWTLPPTSSHGAVPGAVPVAAAAEVVVEATCTAALVEHKGNVWGVALGYRRLHPLALTAGHDATAKVWALDGPRKAAGACAGSSPPRLSSIATLKHPECKYLAHEGRKSQGSSTPVRSGAAGER